MRRRNWLPSVLICLLAFLPLGGCLTARQKAQLSRQPINRVFDPGEVAPLAWGEDQRLALHAQGGAQSICVLQLAKGAKLGKRYHKSHDVTLMVVSGSAIVRVEDVPYFVEAGSAVFLPRYTAYAVLPHKTETELVALLAYTPRYEGKDVVLED